MSSPYESKAYVSAMQALQKKVSLLEEENVLLNQYLDEAQETIQGLKEELLAKDEIFRALEEKLKLANQVLEEELAEKSCQIQQLEAELHQSLLECSKAMQAQIQERSQIEEQQLQIQKLKQVIRKLKEPRDEYARQTQSERKKPYQSMLDEAVDSYFLRKNDEQAEYQLLIRRIQKMEKEIEQLDQDSANRQIVDEKIKVLQELQAQEESLLQQL